MDTDESGTLSRDTSTNIPSHYQTPLLGSPSKSMDSSTMYAPQQDAQHTLPKSQADNQRATHLVWHICHLCNVLLSQLSAFLSLETLYRHETTNGAILPLQHGPLVGAQATMMIDGCKNLDKAVEELLYTSAHLDFMQRPPFRCLLETARGLSYATGKFPQAFELSHEFH